MTADTRRRILTAGIAAALLAPGCAALERADAAASARRVTVYGDGGIALEALQRIDDDARLARTNGATSRPRYALGVGDALGVAMFSPLVEPTPGEIRTADVPLIADASR